MVNRFHLLARGNKINTVNADLWHWVLISLSSLGLERIQVITSKVAAHQKRHQARVWNNDSADLAAKAANLARPQAFWHFWQRLVTEHKECEHMFLEVSNLHLAVAELSVMTQAGTTLDDVVDTRPCVLLGSLTCMKLRRSFGTATIFPRSVTLNRGPVESKNWWEGPTDIQRVPFHVILAGLSNDVWLPGSDPCWEILGGVANETLLDPRSTWSYGAICAGPASFCSVSGNHRVWG